MNAIGLRVIQAGHRLSARARAQALRARVARLRGRAASRLRELVTVERRHRVRPRPSVRCRQLGSRLAGPRAGGRTTRSSSPGWGVPPAGEPRVLTTAPVRVFERTSGSTAANKLVPYTDRLLAEFPPQRGRGCTICTRRCRRCAARPATGRSRRLPAQPERTAGGIPIGFEDDTEYFGPFSPPGLASHAGGPFGSGPASRTWRPGPQRRSSIWSRQQTSA